MKIKHYRNISNYFSEVDDIGEALRGLLNADIEAVFGVEIELTKGVMSLALITPPYIRLGAEPRFRRLISRESDLNCYEGYLVEPTFLPLYEALNGEFLRYIKEVTLDKDEAVAIQWLLKKRSDDWKLNALEMYGSYLEGNEYPSKFRIIRTVQEKILSTLNKMSSFDVTKPYIQEVEAKLLSEGYQFQLRALVHSKDPDKIVEQVEGTLEKYDSYNAIRLYRQKDKRFKRLYRECILTYGSSTQILSKQEISALFGCGIQSQENGIKVIQSHNSSKQYTKDLIALLPKYQRKEVKVDENIVNKIAEALKRVGLIKQSRVYNESVTAGIRLTIVQCDIPKGKTITNLINKTADIQAALGVPSLSIEQGDRADTVKFTVPNEEPAIISLRELIELESFQQFAKENPLSFIVGVDEINNPIYLSLSKLVHLMVAGTTGSGKSVFLNSLILSLLVMHTPEELRMFMIDPKQVELQHFAGFPHVEDVITDMQRATVILNAIVEEMERRYTKFKEAGAKNIALYNQKSEKPIPYIVCVIDEYADLKDTNKDIEEYIARLGQKARAAGIHLVIATQRPSSDIISSRIKANIPNAISFNLNSNNNYKTVFGKGLGGVTLLGRGDGIMKIEGYPKEFQRFQSAIISPDESKEEEVFEAMIHYYSDSETGKPYSLEVPIDNSEQEEIKDHEEPLLDQLKKIILETGDTKVESLRKTLGVKNATLIELMSQLVDEGFLI
ncbi:FtsK/SpoIIIE domain-containing protein, partial [Collinsella aerofaciens]|uniref:FtsK/SpoIIIE domain-containing protein n=2 Tax=Collinsella aerofaciens TaxID=74426 RepID=UPI0021F7C76C